MITHERWQQAQIAERGFHTEGFETGRVHYAHSYRHYFSYLDINPALNGLRVVEIGPADFPALAYCSGTQNCLIIEPLPSDHLRRFDLPIVQGLAENEHYEADEVWLFNVLQHVLDPYKIVERAKKQTKVIRFFEPINYGVNDAHSWNLTMEMFKEWFGECAQHYPGRTDLNYFHTHECAYGVWRKTEC